LITVRQTNHSAVSTKISQTFHVREVINLPKLTQKQADPDKGSEAAASITRSTIRAPRPQVKGLKMRYFPSGNDDHVPMTLGDSDSEDEGPPSQAQGGLAVPNGLHPPSKAEKRKHRHSHGDGTVDAPANKHKKQRTEEEAKRKEEKKAKKRDKDAKKSKS
jgi:hypothetical protein